MPPAEIRVFEPHLIGRGPDEIRGQVGSHTFIYTRYPDPEGNRWFARPGHVGHEEMTNSLGMLQALFGPEAEAVYRRVVTIGEVYATDGGGFFAPTGAR